ncbi:MAG: UDP-N-acetylglucosamine--N-acetylmuramyl-(pentapeptide) pyrophosphoryl-undecaprenol N-acetylglucosamine transferase [Holosporales bacterium]|jgi:UDP-N-acetylglucosamine--N-acetylmuramyl-(pentapeptide) pyrophosphoryl-undecaprenol N-acetylglucosamine transferase|nr:UDP-N-acetylglucosamine--N-acetylmuramyl-(pentapeptide) pyrophosphoryl-undecaprenol N-acetylglucosamine transferase [Holosporales bacterium]
MCGNPSFQGRVVLCAFGTGGHLFPALSVFSKLKKEHDPILLLDARGAVYCQHLADCEKREISGGRSLASLRAFLQNMRLLYRCWRKEPPAAVIGFGGCATLAPLLLARLLGIPTLIHEQNAVMGRANRVLSLFVQRVLLSFPETRRSLRVNKRRFTGVPIRPEFLGDTPPPLKKRGDLRLCVLGGSQGARVFFSVIPRALVLLPETLRKRLFVVQQVQEADLPFVEAFYKIHAIRCELFCFSDKPEALVKDAHLVVCRAGASSLAELAALGRPVLMIPYPYATDNHQAENARFYTEHRAGWCLLEEDFSPASCAAFLAEHLADLSGLENAGRAMRNLAKIDAAEIVASEIAALRRS